MGCGTLTISETSDMETLLTGNPQISHFSIVYRRHTNFGKHVTKHNTFTLDVDNPSDTIITISSDDTDIYDLISNIFLEVDLPEVTFKTTIDVVINDIEAGWTYNTGHALLEKATLSVNNGSDTYHVLDEHTSKFMDIYRKLYDKDNSKFNILNVQSDYDDIQQYSTLQKLKLFIPLDFQFFRETGLPLPLIAVKDIKLELNFRGIQYLINAENDTTGGDFVITPNPSSINLNVYVETIKLGTDEQNRFKNNTLTYLFEQTQRYEDKTIADTITLSNSDKNKFQNQIKELYWVFSYTPSSITTTVGETDITTRVLTDTSHVRGNQGSNCFFDYYLPYNPSDGTDHQNLIYNVDGLNHYNMFKTAQILYDSKDSSSTNLYDTHPDMCPEYYSYFVPYHLNTRSINRQTEAPTNIYVYSFSLNTQEYQPYGSCNFNNNYYNLKLNNLISEYSEATFKISIYAISYSIMEITDKNVIIVNKLDLNIS